MWNLIAAAVVIIPIAGCTVRPVVGEDGKTIKVIAGTSEELGQAISNACQYTVALNGLSTILNFYTQNPATLTISQMAVEFCTELNNATKPARMRSGTPVSVELGDGNTVTAVYQGDAEGI